MLVHFELKITIKLQNCDALFSLEFVRVHSTLIANFDPSVTQERVNQGGFAVIDVGNNSNIPRFFQIFLGAGCKLSVLAEPHVVLNLHERGAFLQ